MARNRRPLCVNPHCSIRGRHAPTCETPEQCRGCLPRPAHDGAYLCDLCTTRITENAADAATLWTDLGEVLIQTGGRGEKTSGSSTGAPVPRDDVIAARTAIKDTLTRVVKMITEERGISLPTIARPLRPEPGARTITYADTSVATLARFIATHAEWLAAHRAADEHAADIHEAARNSKTRNLAYPCYGSDRIFIGECPTPLQYDDGTEEVCGTRIYATGDPLITCPYCGTSDTVEQWQRWIVGTQESPIADAYAIAAHLALTWMRPVDPGLLSVWAVRGRISHAMEPDRDGDEARRMRDNKGRALYMLDTVTAYATTIWGTPPAKRRAS